MCGGVAQRLIVQSIMRYVRADVEFDTLHLHTINEALELIVDQTDHVCFLAFLSLNTRVRGIQL